MGNSMGVGMAAYRSCGGMTVKRDVYWADDTLAPMKVLKRFDNPVLLQVCCDALEERGIAFALSNAGMNALMPLPDVMDARLLVHVADMEAARQVLADLEAMEPLKND